MDTRSLFKSAAAAALVALSAVSTNAITIEYQATNLADTTPGQDLWRYTYKISGYAFQANEGLDIYFAQNLYGALSNPQPQGQQWYAGTSTVIQPNGTPQIYDVLTIVSNPSMDVVFSVDFVWLGGANTPGSQPFDVYRSSQTGGLDVFQEGRTQTASVPEAGSSLLLASLAFGALSTRRFLRK